LQALFSDLLYKFTPMPQTIFQKMWKFFLFIFYATFRSPEKALSGSPEKVLFGSPEKALSGSPKKAPRNLLYFILNHTNAMMSSRKWHYTNVPLFYFL